MIKPPAIVRFEQLYWGSFILGLVATAVTWSSRTAIMNANPAVANMPWIMPTATVVGIVITLTLWYFIARSPSVVAKWVIVVFAALGAFGMATSLFLLARGAVTEVMPGVLSLVVNGLYIAAAVMLFNPAAKAWLGEDRDEDVDPAAPATVVDRDPLA